MVFKIDDKRVTMTLKALGQSLGATRQQRAEIFHSSMQSPVQINGREVAMVSK